MLFSMENTNGKHSQIKYISFLGGSVMQQWLHKWEMHIDKISQTSVDTFTSAIQDTVSVYHADEWHFLKIQH